jgi:cytochrome c oxidase subunit 2
VKPLNLGAPVRTPRGLRQHCRHSSERHGKTPGHLRMSLGHVPRAFLLAALALAACAHPQLVTIHAKRYSYTPSEVTVKRGRPVVLELIADDREHGFDLPELGLEANLQPGVPAHVEFTPQKAGRFDFHCDVFCGSGHEGMEGTLIVEP